MALIAAHPRDIHGAASAGLRTAYLRSERPFPPTFAEPDITAHDLVGCARALL